MAGSPSTASAAHIIGNGAACLGEGAETSGELVAGLIPTTSRRSRSRPTHVAHILGKLDLRSRAAVGAALR
jgi:hypothetical protein